MAEPLVVVSEGAVNEAALATRAPVTSTERATLIAPVEIAPSVNSRASCPLPATVIAWVTIGPLPALMVSVDGPLITSGSAIAPMPTVIAPVALNPEALVAARLAPLTVPSAIAPLPPNALIADPPKAVPPDSVLLGSAMPLPALSTIGSAPMPSLFAVSVSKPAPWPIVPVVEVIRTAPFAAWVAGLVPPSTTLPCAVTV